MLRPDRRLRGLATAWGLALMASLQPVAAEPVTLYKPPQIEAARENVARYEWARKLLAGYRSQVAYLIDQERALIDAFVPDQTPWPIYGQTCPVCVGKQSAMGETGIYRWSPIDPDHLTCKYCGTVYPNPDYPETGRLECPRMGQTFTYYLTEAEREHPGDVSGKYAFRWASWPVHTSWSGLIRRNRASYAVSRILPLAKLYALTGEVRAAERCAWLLDRLAEVYPNYLYHSYNGTYADCPPGEAASEMGRHPRAGRFAPGVIVSAFPHLVDRNGDGFGELNNGFWGAGRITSGVGGEGSILLGCTVAYDLVRDAVDDQGRPILTPAMRRKIERNLILAGCADLENYPDINNKCGPGRALSGAVGILFRDPRRVRRALEGFERLLADAFHSDGFCVESPSYSGMHLGLMREIPELLDGYSDPPDYEPAAGDRKLVDFDPFEELPRYRLALESMARMLRPDRRYPVIGDTHSGSGISVVYAEILAAHYGDRYAGLVATAQGAPLAEKGHEYALWHRRPDLEAAGKSDLPLRSEWFPGWHVGVLRLGGPESRTAFYLNGYARHGHRHDDTLGLIYFDLGKELASDRGYIWDDPRNAWTRSTLAHNIVTVDGASQTGKDRHSTLELFDRGPGIEVVQASANAYQQCSTYRRTCVLVKVDDRHTYALDIFRVSGGKLHQYGFHCQGSLVHVEGADPRPIDRQHKWLTNFRAAAPAPSGWRATWEYEGARTDLLMLSDAARLVVVDAPGWRSGKGDQLHAPPIQQVLVENEGADLATTYVALISPYEGEESPVKEAALLQPVDAGVVAVRIELPGRTDWLVSALDDAPHTCGPLEVAGRFAYVSVGADGELRSARLVGGTRLKLGDVELSAARPGAKVKVAAVNDRVIELAEPLPEGFGARGSYLYAGGTGYEIEATDGRRITIRDYPVAPTETIELLTVLSAPGSE